MVSVQAGGLPAEALNTLTNLFIRAILKKFRSAGLLLRAGPGLFVISALSSDAAFAAGRSFKLAAV